VSKDDAIYIAENHLGNKSSEIGTNVLSNDFLVVVTGNRYWLIGIENTFIKINAYNGEILNVEKY